MLNLHFIECQLPLPACTTFHTAVEYVLRCRYGVLYWDNVLRVKVSFFRLRHLITVILYVLVQHLEVNLSSNYFRAVPR